MAVLKLTVERTDGSKATYRVLPVTKVAFERHFACGIGTLGQSKKEEHVYWLAWDAEHRSGRVVKPFDDWLNEIEDITVEDEPTPFVEGASPSPSPDSLS